MKTIVRKMKDQDLRWITAIEKVSFRNSFWDKRKFTNYPGLVAEVEKFVVGYALYQEQSRTIHLLRMAVTPQLRRRSVGKKIIESLAASLSLDRLVRIETVVEAENVTAQFFLKQCRFRAFGTVTNDQNEEYYLFECALPGFESSFYSHRPRNRNRPCQPANRITQYLQP